MAIIPLPDEAWRPIVWTPVDPTQVNRSEFTSAQQVVGLPGAAFMQAECTHVPVVGEDNILPWRAFFRRLRGRVNRFRLPATQAVQTSTNFTGQGPNFGLLGVNTTVVARQVTKTGGANNAWDAGAHSVVMVGAGGARMQFRSGDTTKTFQAGLNADPTTDNDQAGIDYSFRCTGTALNIYESGSNINSYGTITTEDVLSVVYRSSQIRYYRNGELLRSVAVGAALNLYADSSYFTTGAVLADSFFSGSPAIYTVAAGDRTVVFRGFTALAQNVIKAGWRMTALLDGGGEQLLEVTENASADGSGNATVLFEPMLLGLPIAFVTRRPWGLMTMDEDRVPIEAGEGQIYGFGFSCTEAFYDGD